MFIMNVWTLQYKQWSVQACSTVRMYAVTKDNISYWSGIDRRRKRERGST